MKGEQAPSSDDANVSIIGTLLSFKLSYNFVAVRPLFIFNRSHYLTNYIVLLQCNTLETFH